MTSPPPLRLGVLGRGRLGTLLAEAARAAPDVELAWCLGRDGTPLAPVDVAVDVSHAEAVAGHLRWARASGSDLVIGTTGWDPGLLTEDPEPDGASGGTGVLVAPNFSLSVALVRRLSVLLGRYAAELGAGRLAPADLSVHDRHHRHKADAPSGTARLLAHALAEGAGREAGSVACTSLRAGAFVGRHEVRVDTDQESLTLTHEVHDRTVFATGALAAARWVHGRPGRHTLDDLAADLLDRLWPAAA